MAAPGNANTVNGMITNVVAGPGADESTVTTNQNLADQDQYQCPQGRYPTPCQLNTGGRPYNTRGNAMGANATVTMSLRDAQNNLQPAPTANQPFTLHDDDQDNVLPQPVAAPNAWLAWLQSSDLRTENLFADAYVRPILDGGGNAANNQTALPFSPNVEITIPVIRTQIAAGKQVTGDENFWVSYVQANFQGGRDHDNDPNGEVGFIPGIGLVGAIFGVTPVPGDASLIFVESYRDGCGGLTAVAGQREGVREVVIHEIGHQFRGDHPDGGIRGDYLQGTCMPPQSAFTDITLNRIRSIPRPGM